LSFRSRLTFFFVVIVIVPMIAMAAVLFRLISDNTAGKRDAGVSARLDTAQQLYRRDETDATARTRIVTVGSDHVLARSFALDNIARATRRAQQLLVSQQLSRIVVERGGEPIVDVGDPTAVAPIARDLVAPTGLPLGLRLEVSDTTAARYARTLQQLTKLQSVVHDGPTVLGATLASVPASVLAPHRTAVDVHVGGHTYRLASFPVQGFEGSTMTVTTLAAPTLTKQSVSPSRLLAGLFIGVFLLGAFGFAMLVSRSLQRQIASFLAAARRLGAGDFSSPVPTVGHDEFALLGNEFNKMSHELERRLEQLGQERTRLQIALRRIGETFASNLDRDALLDIVLQTAVDGVGAAGGRASACENGGTLVERSRAGELDDDQQHALRDAEEAVLASGRTETVQVGEACAVGHPLTGDGRVLGLIAVARESRGFEDGEHELLAYLAGQAAVSIENVDLHERVQRQAVTDELTGLYNHRRFQEAIGRELERSRRFGQHLALVMLDLDNFKRVNDSYGHQQGDLVLREAARIVRENSREVDSPARYGGEEFAVVLPGTDLDGAVALAERIRAGILALRIPRVDGEGTLEITASLGAAAATRSTTPAELIAAADGALYEAKNSGKNKTVRAR
jgi:diguanylate cyclase (GGDEF)-like protein